MEIADSFCRICLNGCALKVSVEAGKVVSVQGDFENPLFKGFTCIKGRAQPDYLYHPDRLLHSLKRNANGGFDSIGWEIAADEVALRLREIIEESGPQAVAVYAGTMLWASYSTSMIALKSFLDVIGSPMWFDPDTIDKAGKLVASGLHGEWGAPAQDFVDPDVMLLIGINPLVTFTGIPAGNPGQWLKDQARRGMKLIVIDPRVSDVAKRADTHLSPMPGYDVDILACLIRTVLSEGLIDSEFVRENVQGVETLQKYVDPFDPATVARRTGLAPSDLITVARDFATKKRGYVMAGTGPHMSGEGTLTEYLVLALQSLCGCWMRAGEKAKATPALLPMPEYKAQARQPDEHWGTGQPIGLHGLLKTRAGYPIMALPDLIRSDDPERRVRALICVGGNPVAAVPDSRKTARALEYLDLLVQLDPWMSATARIADYVIAPTMPLEVPATTQGLDFLSQWTGYGLGQSYAQYTHPVVDPPPGSDVVDEWRFLQRLARQVPPGADQAGGARSSAFVDKCETRDDVIELSTASSRIPMDLVKPKSGGHFYPDDPVIVADKDPGWTAKFDLGNRDMMADLKRRAIEGPSAEPSDGQFPFRLLCRRHRHVYNSSCNVDATNRGKPYNPVFLYPEDMNRLGLSSGDRVLIRSAHGEARAIVEEDTGLLPGLASIMFAFGAGEIDAEDASQSGTNPNLLMSYDLLYERYIGQPRMSNLPIDIMKEDLD